MSDRRKYDILPVYPNIDYISFDDFRKDGYLQEANRRFFHPLGLALEAHPNGLLRVEDFRDDPEGVYFVGINLKPKADRIDELWNQKEQTRVGALGFMTQPRTSK